MFGTRPHFIVALLAGTALAGIPSARAGELPTGPSVAYGAVGITAPSANALAIQQSSANAIINWQGFSIGAGSRVDISQPSAGSALLNRVTGSTPSSIAGQLNANGQVYLVNPNGILITPTGTVRAGAFVGSTLGITDDDFKAGRRTFNGTGSSASVVNQGTIEIGQGGYAALIGGRVENSGLISVPLGRIGLGAGESATLDLSGDGFLQVAVPSRSDGNAEALIQSSGRLRAPGGRIEIQAATAREAARQAINLSGLVEARSLGGRSGAIVLGGGAGGGVAVSGRLNVSGAARRHASVRPVAPVRGGTITVTGDTIRLTGARLDASGTGGGGTIRVGGDLKGSGTLQRASTTSVDAATTIKADGKGASDGGSIVVWSDQSTNFAGAISARGGETGGNGGSAEVSGKSLLVYTGTADLSAPLGSFGTLLLDPYNVFVTNGATAGNALDGGTFVPSANDSVINATTLATALGTANVTVTTGGLGSPGAQAGDIAIQAPISWTAGTTLTLSALRNIAIDAPITALNGGLTLSAGSTDPAAPGAITASGAVNVGVFTLGLGNWSQIGAALPGFGVADFRLTGGSFLRAAGGTGTTADPYLITDVFGLQGIGSSAALLAGSYRLATSINAGGTALWNAGAGFAPIGQTAIGGGPLGFAGTFDGGSAAGFLIAGLRINRPAETNVGLFGALAPGASISNIILSNGSTRGLAEVGSLVGTVAAGSRVVTAAVLDSVVQGTTDVGGLLGQSSGTIQAAGAIATVTGVTNVGGLVGNQIAGTMTLVGAQGAINGTTAVGGLAGLASGTTANAVSLGSVTGQVDVGGLIGQAASATIRNANSGSVVAGTAPNTSAGGLVGRVFGTSTVTSSFATGAVSGGTAGGLAGQVGGTATIADSYAYGAVNGQVAAGGLVGTLGDGSAPGPTLARTYATGLVTGAAGAATGGLIGTSAGPASVTTSYWNTQTSGQAASAGGGGVTGETTAQLQAALPAGFSPATWGILPGQSYPYLLSRFGTGPLIVSGSVTSAGGAPVVGTGVTLAAGGSVLAVPGVTTIPFGLLRSATSGADGSYYFATDAITTPGLQGLTAFLSSGALIGSSSTQAPTGAGAVTGLDVQVNRALVTTTQTSASQVALLLQTAGDSTLNTRGDDVLAVKIPYRVSFNAITFAPGTSVRIDATNAAGFAVDRSILANGSLVLEGAGTTGSTGPVSIAAGQTLQSQTGDVVVATNQFTNAAGATGIQAAGRFLVYSQDFAADTTGGLAGGTLYGFSYAGNPPGSITVPGSQFLYTRAAPTPPAPPVTPADQGTDVARAVAEISPTLSRQLPILFAAANELADSLDLTLGGGSGGGGGGPSLGTGTATTRTAAAQTLTSVQRSSADLERRLAACERENRSSDGYKSCVGGALDQFAQALDARILELPAPLRNVTAIIREAAQRVRSATTIAEARTSVRAAVAEVRKAIALIRADEPAVTRLQVRQGNAIASALQAVDNRLARAVGL